MEAWPSSGKAIKKKTLKVTVIQKTRKVVIFRFKFKLWPQVVTHDFNPNIQEIGSGGPL